jgi:epoxyqueuosine reductase
MSSVTAADATQLETLLREESKALGFSALAIAQAISLPRGEFFKRWLELGFGGKMSYLYRNLTSRKNPREAWPEVRTVVTVAMNYHTGIRPTSEKNESREGQGNHRQRLIGAISRYAWGRDYHKVLRKRLLKLARVVEQSGIGRAVKCYVDTGPVIEREWGARAGLGWIGKNTLLLDSNLGSWFFVGVMLLDVALPSDEPKPDLCGTCDRCIRACPTGALIRPYVMDARRCISYLNIELRGWIPRDLRPLMGNWVFGCDDCQSVCPYNQDAPVTAIRDFQPRDGLDAPDLIELLEMDEEAFRNRFEGTPILRARWTGLVRNAAVALGNSGDARAIEPLGQTLQHPEATVRGHAAWALGNLGGPRAEDLLEKHMRLEKDPEAFEEITAAIQQVREAKAFS